MVAALFEEATTNGDVVDWPYTSEVVVGSEVISPPALLAVSPNVEDSVPTEDGSVGLLTADELGGNDIELPMV